MNYIFILVGVVIIIILFMLYLSMTKSSNVITQNYLPNGMITVNAPDLVNYGSMSYEFELWIYATSVSGAASDPKTTYGPTANPNGNLFHISEMTNNSVISLDLYKNSALYLHTSSSNRYKITDAFPLNKWQHVIVSVNNDVFDLYLDGKLVKSYKLTQNLLLQKQSKITFGKGPIYIAGFKREADSVTPTTAWQKYMAGNKVIRNPFALSFDIHRDNKIRKKYVVM
jgi:hypothetical protein